MGNNYAFAFLPAGHGYLIFSGSDSVKSWLGATNDLGDALGTHSKGEVINAFAAGLDGDFFMCTDKHIIYHTPTQEGVVSNVVCVSRSLGINISAINWMEFMPNPAGYFFTTNTGACHWADVPSTLDTHLKAKGGANIWSLSVGKGDAWVTVTKSGLVTWCGIPEMLAEKLKQTITGDIVVRPTPKVVKELLRLMPFLTYVNLCLHNTSSWFIQYADGRTHWMTPKSWHENMCKYFHQQGTWQWNKVVPWRTQQLSPSTTPAHRKSSGFGRNLLKAAVGGVVKSVIANATGQQYYSSDYGSGGGVDFSSVDMVFQQSSQQSMWGADQLAASSAIQ